MPEGEGMSSDKENYIKTLDEGLKYSISKFDGQTLAISGGALGLSLSFIKDIVPFESSIYNIVLYAAQFLFTYAITIGFISHYLSLRGSIRAIAHAEADKFSEIVTENNKANTWINRCNTSIVIALPLGIFLLVTYCLINIENARGVKTATKKATEIHIQKDLGNGTTFSIEGDLKAFKFNDSTKDNTSIKIK
jgi:hypothetical protein